MTPARVVQVVEEKLSSVSNIPEKASTEEATAGTNNTKYMTPATTAAAISNALGVVETSLDAINGEVV